MLPDYTYYKSNYLGSEIDEESFPRLIKRAGAYLSQFECDNTTQSYKMAACAVAEAWQINEQGGDVVSQSVGSWSKTFANGAKPKGNEQRLSDAAKLYLGACVSVRWL